LPSDVKDIAEFEPVYAGESPHGWRVRARLPSGARTDLGAFETREDALEWIALKSAEWLALARCERNRSYAGAR
jgi:hypothetical protein